MTDNPLVFTSILLIKKIWHGHLGYRYKSKRNIICRFYPTCSNYAIIALGKYGFIKGWFLTYKRIKRCIPENTDSCIDFP